MRERFYNWLAWHLPRRVAYHAFIRVAAHATVGAYSGQIVPDLTIFVALQRWEDEASLANSSNLRHDRELTSNEPSSEQGPTL